jgi:pyridoxal phosphate enzyme (YggS family)
MEQACRRSGREPSSVQLIAVSKTFPAERVRQALAVGQHCFGENRVQEALGKMDQLPGEARWHLIGALQTNKARQAVGAFELIHGVDRPSLAIELDRRAASRELRQSILLQVRLGGEASKAGVDESELSALAAQVCRLPQLELRGLMCIPPPVEQPEQARRWFARLRELRDALLPEVGPLPELSMGMSHDFEIAIEEGATLVRVGRAIFGERPRPPAA